MVAFAVVVMNVGTSMSHDTSPLMDSSDVPHDLVQLPHGVRPPHEGAALS